MRITYICTHIIKVICDNFYNIHICARNILFLQYIAINIYIYILTLKINIYHYFYFKLNKFWFFYFIKCILIMKKSPISRSEADPIWN